MDVRSALQQQGPSLALQRAAGDLVAKLDAELAVLEKRLEETEAENKKLLSIISSMKGKKHA